MKAYKFQGIMEMLCEEYGNDILLLAYKFVQSLFVNDKIKSAFGQIKEFPPHYECSVGFETDTGGFLYQCRYTGDYILYYFEKDDCLNFIKQALSQGEEK